MGTLNAPTRQAFDAAEARMIEEIERLEREDDAWDRMRHAADLDDDDLYDGDISTCQSCGQYWDGIRHKACPSCGGYLG